MRSPPCRRHEAHEAHETRNGDPGFGSGGGWLFFGSMAYLACVCGIWGVFAGWEGGGGYMGKVKIRFMGVTNMVW